MKAKRKLSRSRLIIIIALVAVAVVSFTFIALNLVFKTPASNWYSNSERAFELPLSDRNFSANAICYDSSNNTYLVAGSIKASGDESRSTPIYVVDGTTKEITKTIYIQDKNRQLFTGTITDIAIYNSHFVYIADGSDTLLTFSHVQFKLTENGKTVQLKSSYTFRHSDTDYLNAYFLEVYGDKLYVGERAENVNPIPSHNVTTNGQTNSGLVLTYSIAIYYSAGIAPTPSQAYSIPAYANDIMINASKFYLVCANGVGTSSIHEYNKDIVHQTSSGVFSVLSDENNVSLYTLSKKSLIQTFTTPMNAQGTFLVDNMFYIVFGKTNTLFDFYGEFKYCYKTDLISLRTKK